MAAYDARGNGFQTETLDKPPCSSWTIFSLLVLLMVCISQLERIFEVEGFAMTVTLGFYWNMFATLKESQGRTAGDCLWPSPQKTETERLKFEARVSAILCLRKKENIKQKQTNKQDKTKQTNEQTEPKQEQKGEKSKPEIMLVIWNIPKLLKWFKKKKSS